MEGDFYTLFQSQRGERLVNIPVFPIYGTSLPPPRGTLQFYQVCYKTTSLAVAGKVHLWPCICRRLLCLVVLCVFFLSTCNCNLSSSTNFQDIWNPAKSFNLGQSCRDTPHRHFFFLSCWQNGNHRQMSARHSLPFSYPVLEGFRKFLAYFVK